MTKTLKLSKPLKQPSEGGTKEIPEISFRRPTYADMKECGGEPFHHAISGAAGDLLLVVVRDDVVEKYIERLSGIAPEILLQMDIDDTLKARDIVTGFFKRTPPDGTNKPSA